MARRASKKTEEQILMQRWWVRALVALAFLGLAYGFASLAIDSGSLLEYAIAIILIWWAFKHGYRAIRYAFFR